jgi:hypothetical protein
MNNEQTFLLPSGRVLPREVSMNKIGFPNPSFIEFEDLDGEYN